MYRETWLTEQMLLLYLFSFASIRNKSTDVAGWQRICAESRYRKSCTMNRYVKIWNVWCDLIQTEFHQLLRFLALLFMSLFFFFFCLCVCECTFIWVLLRDAQMSETYRIVDWSIHFVSVIRITSINDNINADNRHIQTYPASSAYLYAFTSTHMDTIAGTVPGRACDTHRRTFIGNLELI